MARTIAKDYDEKRAHILKTAARVFAEQGFARASMSQVAGACGISKANIYHYYDSKDALLFDILDSYLSALRDRLADLPLEGRTPADQLRLILTEALLAYEGMDHEHQIQTEGIPMLGSEEQDVLKGYQRDMVRQLSSVLRAVAPDVFATDRDKLRAATMSVFGMLNWFYMWNSSATRDDREAYAETVARLTLGGVGGL
ncbi:MAG: TetR/AcrR family transcriptional regulator [Marinibacterium sp.]|nr:TetR/AcrR family transcriptional regulator [Marinibacterium sp.]